MLYKEISHCRICGNTNLISVLNLGEQALTGVFPKIGEAAETGPLEMVKCVGPNPEACGLVQLRHNYEPSKLYGETYGYRSGLNQSMVRHLRTIVEDIEKRLPLADGDLVIDIASNDGTLLSSYSNKNLDLVGIDPTIAKFGHHYPDHVDKIADFFSKSAIETARPDKKAKVITTVAMFYDLQQPLETMKEIASILTTDGIWVVEQSYLPYMLQSGSYDTVCHEHLEFYALQQFQWMAKRAGLKIIDVEFNDANGGSFRLTLAHEISPYEVSVRIKEASANETAQGIDRLETYEIFATNARQHRAELKKLVTDLKAAGKKIIGYGASTKGNVLLQYCGLTTDDISFIADVNDDKFGRATPGTVIPIISETEAREREPDYFLVLPWHFKKGIIDREKDFIKRGGKLIFPLPTIHIIGND